MSITKLDILKQAHKHLVIESDFASESAFLCIAVALAAVELKGAKYSEACADIDVYQIQCSVITRIYPAGCMEKFLENLTGKRPTPAEAFEARVKLLNELIAEEENKNDTV